MMGILRKLRGFMIVSLDLLLRIKTDELSFRVIETRRSLCSAWKSSKSAEFDRRMKFEAIVNSKIKRESLGRKQSPEKESIILKRLCQLD
jgi:hypothetical protein